MSSQSLFAVLEKLVSLHKSLYNLALQKTEIVKNGDMTGLNELLQNEQKHLGAIKTVEAERQKTAVNFLLERYGAHSKSEPTISDCIDVAKDEEKHELRSLQQSLAEAIEQLKERNELNQRLLLQSLQFVHLNLSMLQPQKPQATYGNPVQGKKPTAARSLFDSKA
ncbi:hypothetical protein Q75_15305 [Bacillus coahuilensis p1.1.43]|uniref:Flagellar biosynthesis protein FlgN n=1 Tax=Bacillus coahuilensis p1.1.43 TaxID=1150625 RepID=A0A147K4U6_9BACI|nr:flagellar protein FlgN [Bacillus coahuilensis]KUP04468.1 hypothetical protein Q75_15305 [Bacillus coahuilensis p1.1.43]